MVITKVLLLCGTYFKNPTPISKRFFLTRYSEKTNTGKQLDWPHASVSLLLLGMLAWGGPPERKELGERERERGQTADSLRRHRIERADITIKVIRNTTHFLNLCLGVGIVYSSRQILTIFY
jgi:hypothetical protein